MVCAMSAGAVSAATELMVMAATATTMWRFSSATSGANRLIPLRSDTGDRWPSPVSSLYFVVAGAALRIEELDIFGRRLHQFLVPAGGQNLSFHQKNDLVVIHYRRYLLRYRDERYAGIIVANVLQNRPLRRRIHA